MKTAAVQDKIITYSFCESFKENLIRYIQKEFIDTKADLSRLAVVFGGKRPALFLKRDLAGKLNKSFYPPAFFTIDEFIQYTVRKSVTFRQPQDMDNCFLLYKLAKKVTPRILEGRETFAAFLPWIREILTFIDQLDLEDIGEKALHAVRANAQIGYDVPGDINQLLEHIVVLRRAYHEELMAARSYSRGLQYLTAAKDVGEHDFAEFDQILFCNFFYFHRTEEKVVKSLYERDKATLIFQGDQRKWPVLHRISKMFACPIREGERPQEPKFSLGLYAGFDVHSQAALLREVLKSIKTPERAVIVLPEPDHLIPVLSEIGTLVKEYNVSMGYPLKRSSLFSLFELIFRAQLSIKNGRYYARDYLKALRHPFIKNLKLSANPTVTRILMHKIEEVLTGRQKTAISGSLFLDLGDMLELDDIYSLTSDMLKRLAITVSKKELKGILETVHELLFNQWEAMENFRDFAAALDNFLAVLVDKSFLANYPLNLNIASKIYEVQEEFRNAAFAGERFDKEEMFRIFEHKMSHEKIAFAGSPLKGLQILGLLETRALNFEHVIILDTNEGVLPKLNIHEPLIPREVMISLGLDRLELEEEIQRYQFMRLISSAQNVHLIYQESKDKERSRFIEELVWDKQKKSGIFTGEPALQPSFRVNIRPERKSVAKTPEMLAFLKKHVFSASSINMYMRNPMDFYINYVLGLREQEDLLDEPEARHVGTFIHELLEEGFRPLLNKRPKIDQTFRGRFMAMFEKKFEETFARTMKSDSFLLKAVVAQRLSRFLDNEQFNGERQVNKILHLESRFEGGVQLSSGKFKFRYVIDRIDRCSDGTVLILDYKTGGADLMPRPANQLNGLAWSRATALEHIKSFQLPLYVHYLGQEFPDDQVNAALYNLRTLKLHKFAEPMAAAQRTEFNAVYLEALNFLMSEILDPGVPFEEDERETYF